LFRKFFKIRFIFPFLLEHILYNIESIYIQSIHEQPLLSSPTSQRFSHDSFTTILILKYPKYLRNIYINSSRESMVRTIKIHINSLFPSNQMNESSSEMNRREHNSSSSSSSRNRSRSPSTDRRVIISSTKTRQEHHDRKVQREKYIREKELIFKRQSSSICKSKDHHHSSSNRSESKEGKLKRLYNQYSDEDMFKHWKPLLLNDCFELYRYAFEKYHRTS
jgi:hypothetical protein